MTDDSGVLDRVRAAAALRVLFVPHAIKAMARPTPMLTASEGEAVLLNGDVIEDYPEDLRGHSCLMMGAPEGRPIPDFRRRTP